MGRIGIAVFLVLLGAAPARAQETAPPRDEGRACDGCPERSVGKAFLQTTLINVVYELANLARGQVTARITPKTWWDNMENGWVWDLDDFLVNQIGHPYQGSNYFNAGRANGLSFYESAAMAAFGSATWEYFGETNKPSLNDLLNTTLGGIALGEMFHRTGWLIRNPRATGKGRLWSEIGAAVFDPVTGANRFIDGDSSRVSDKPSDMIPSALGATAAAGVLFRGSQSSAFTATGQPFLEIDGLYGDPTTGRSRMPFDAFGVRLRFGGGSAFSEARVRGRLMGQPLLDGALQFSVVQSYDFQGNDAYHFGAQSFEASVGQTAALSDRTRLWWMGWGGATVLGAVDSIPLDAPSDVPPEEDGSAGQGVSEGPRYYDYGPGWNFGGSVALMRGGQARAVFSYEGRHLFSLDGVRANHFLQRGRLDVTAPLKGALGIGVAGEYFDRRTFYQDAARTKKTYHYPQVRAYFTWSLS
ncbi:MAG TPA: DUF3943 domain-containing protein [Vicinamibacterales bacterium]